MSIFATEFRLDPVCDPVLFVEEVLIWLRGVRGSRILDGAEIVPGADAALAHPSGESLQLRGLDAGADWEAVGFRHDIPDVRAPGRAWRTEGVLCRTPTGPLLRIRGQSLATEGLVALERPRPTHLVRSLIENGRVLADGLLEVRQGAHALRHDAEGLDLAEMIFRGEATETLPVLYVSCEADTRHAIPPAHAEQLAKDLAGVAHVVLEPARGFSFDLRDRVGGRNAYGGVLGLVIPGRRGCADVSFRAGRCPPGGRWPRPPSRPPSRPAARWRRKAGAGSNCKRPAFRPNGAVWDRPRPPRSMKRSWRPRTRRSPRSHLNATRPARPCLKCARPPRTAPRGSSTPPSWNVSAPRCGPAR